LIHTTFGNAAGVGDGRSDRDERRIISRKCLNEFALRLRMPSRASQPGIGHDIREDFPAASFLGRHRTVFTIGSQYRLIVDMRYDLGRVYVRRVLTHADYDRLSHRDEL